MIDFARITVEAGSGGHGSGSFLHIKGKRRGKADGGDGGLGGNVYLVATRDLNTLEPFRYIKFYKAKDGASGAHQRCKGADGEDLEIKVPVGTMVTVEDAGPVSRFPPASAKASAGKTASARPSQPSEPSEPSKPIGLRAVGIPATVAPRSSMVFDLVENGQKVLFARGGEGGRGNAKLRDEFGRRPKTGEKGKSGEVVHITLELKLIADVGLIGLPNAGKSTLLSALTAARPAIAPYPFTTLEPNLGVLSTPDDRDIRSSGDQVRAFGNKNTRYPDDPIARRPTSLVLADIPGLIEGASQGRGLGDLFLRHVERTKVLAHLIDASTQSEKWQDYQTVRGELRAYSKELAGKKEIIVLTKIDLTSEQTLKELLNHFKSKRKKVLAISAVTGEGLEELANHIRIYLRVIPSAI